jgi:hypothetical protein
MYYGDTQRKSFEYDGEVQTLSKTEPCGADHGAWMLPTVQNDSMLMKNTRWLLSRPMTFPTMSPKTQISREHYTLRALMILEILCLILLQLIFPELQSVPAAENQAGLEPDTILSPTTRTMFLVLCLNRYVTTQT